MNMTQKLKIKSWIGFLIIIISLIFSLWLSIGVMLIGGINSAIAGFEIGNVSQGVWGIVRAFFFEVGFCPFWIGYVLGYMVMINDI